MLNTEMFTLSVFAPCFLSLFLPPAKVASALAWPAFFQIGAQSSSPWLTHVLVNVSVLLIHLVKPMRTVLMASSVIPDPIYPYRINLRAGQSFQNKTREPHSFITSANWGPYHMEVPIGPVNPKGWKTFSNLARISPQLETVPDCTRKRMQTNTK